MIFITHDNSPKVLQPRKQTFNLPAAFVAAKFPSVLRFGAFAVCFMRRNQLNVEFFQLFVQRVGIVCFIANHLVRSLIGKSLADGSLDQFDFVWRSRFREYGERKTKAICHCHELRAFAPLGLSHRKAPFLAETNVPSIKVSDKSSFPRSNKSWAKVSNTFRSLPSLTHSWNRRWQVWCGGKRSGKSCHRAPERRIQRTPFITSRAWRGGLPRVWISSVFSNNWAIKTHCSSVNSSRRAIGEVYQTIFEMASSFQITKKPIRKLDRLFFMPDPRKSQIFINFLLIFFLQKLGKQNI